MHMQLKESEETARCIHSSIQCRRSSGCNRIPRKKNLG